MTKDELINTRINGAIREETYARYDDNGELLQYLTLKYVMAPEEIEMYNHQEEV